MQIQDKTTEDISKAMERIASQFTRRMNEVTQKMKNNVKELNEDFQSQISNVEENHTKHVKKSFNDLNKNFATILDNLRTQNSIINIFNNSLTLHPEASIKKLKIQDLSHLNQKLKIERISSIHFKKRRNNFKEGIRNNDNFDTICYGCLENNSEILTLPCMHGGLCRKCAVKIFELRKICPCCRHVIEKIYVYEDNGDGEYIAKLRLE